MAEGSFSVDDQTPDAVMEEAHPLMELEQPGWEVTVSEEHPYSTSDIHDLEFLKVSFIIISYHILSLNMLYLGQ